LGVIMYQMLCGATEYPYANADRHVLLPDVAKSFLLSYSTGLRDLVCGLLKAERSTRLGLSEASTIVQALKARPLCTNCGHVHASA